MVCNQWLIVDKIAECIVMKYILDQYVERQGFLTLNPRSIGNLWFYRLVVSLHEFFAKLTTSRMSLTNFLLTYYYFKEIH